VWRWREVEGKEEERQAANEERKEAARKGKEERRTVQVSAIGSTRASEREGG
jgi:hypothetical protein